MFPDPSCLSNVDAVTCTHFHFNWNLDFTSRVISGSALIDIKVIQNSVNVISLDTRDLTVSKITQGTSDEQFEFSLHKVSDVFGSRLDVSLPRPYDADETLQLCVHYRTDPKCSALQWMDPELTCGKKVPYLFSQCQAIHARSLAPCQDSPGVKATYSAEVTAPEAVQVLMSAIKGPTREGGAGVRVHSFRQEVPIPSYLLALAAGDLVSSDISPRVAVWSEPSQVEACRWEFEESEKLMEIAQELCGDYVWGRFDLLVLPPSFPYGGMENPCLTFLTPTLLAGDKSLVDVVAHELAHSWTGNLVTNCSWEHFWLNEGHTVYLERLIGERLRGTPSRHLSMMEGWNTLQDEVNRRGAHDPLTKLVPDLKGVDPDDAFSCVPYEKGSGLLYYLETLVGQPVMLQWLKLYFGKFARSSLNTDQWKSFFLSFLEKAAPFGLAKVEKSCDWQAWLYMPGLPPVSLPKLYDDSLAVGARSLAERCANDQALPSGDSFKELQTKQQLLFLDALGDRPALPHAVLAQLSSACDLEKTKNAEILFRWFKLALKGRYAPVVTKVLTFLDSVGRMKFARPLYRDLFQWAEQRAAAVQHFELRRPCMHPITAEMVARDLRDSA